MQRCSTSSSTTVYTTSARSITGGGNLIGIYSSVMRSGTNTLVSTFESQQTAAQTAMDQTIEDLKNSIT